MSRKTLAPKGKLNAKARQTISHAAAGLLHITWDMSEKRRVVCDNDLLRNAVGEREEWNANRDARARAQPRQQQALYCAFACNAEGAFRNGVRDTLIFGASDPNISKHKMYCNATNHKKRHWLRSEIATPSHKQTWSARRRCSLLHAAVFSIHCVYKEIRRDASSGGLDVKVPSLPG